MSEDLASDNPIPAQITPLFIVRNVMRIMEMAGALTLAVDSELMSLEDAAALRGCTPECLGQFVKSGSLPAAPIYSGKRRKPVIVLVRRRDVEALPPVKHPNARKFRKPVEPKEDVSPKELVDGLETDRSAV